jgi:uncharacterized membrane protein YhiD involved in acid resistance
MAAVGVSVGSGHYLAGVLVTGLVLFIFLIKRTRMDPAERLRSRSSEGDQTRPSE